MFRACDRAVDWLASRLSPRALIVLVAFAPSLLALVLPSALFGRSFTDFLPNSSDEIIYWREIATFVDHGFGGGQYSTNEDIAAFEASPFGSHGPAFTLLYGAIGKVVGWAGNTPFLLHLLLFPVAVLAAVAVWRPNPRQLAIMLLLLLFWWPLQLYIPSSMQEVLHLAAGVLIAALFARVLATQDRASLFWIAVILALLIPIRLTWAFLFFPLLLFSARKIRPAQVLLALVVTGVMTLGGLLFLRTFYSPYPWFSSELIDLLTSNLRAGLSALAGHFFESVALYLTPSLALVTLVRYQLLALVLAMAAWFVVRREESERRFALFHLANLGSVLLFVLFFYDVIDTRDYRMLIAPLLLSAVVLILQNRAGFVNPLIITNILAVVFFVPYMRGFRAANFEYDPQVVQEVREQIDPQLVFSPGADRWCNTISVGKFGSAATPLAYPLTAVHSGFGITTILDWQVFEDKPLRAKYVWLDPDFVETGFGSPVNRFDLVPLAETSLGTLYENPTATCD